MEAVSTWFQHACTGDRQRASPQLHQTLRKTPNTDVPFLVLAHKTLDSRHLAVHQAFSVLVHEQLDDALVVYRSASACASSLRCFNTATAAGVVAGTSRRIRCFVRHACYTRAKRGPPCCTSRVGSVRRVPLEFAAQSGCRADCGCARCVLRTAIGTLMWSLRV